MATTADCYQFACETGVITADELFLQQISDLNEGPPIGSQDGNSRGRGASKKRKVCSDGEAGVGTDSTPPRVLRSLVAVVERYGKFLQYFPFQSLVDGTQDGGGLAKGGNSRPRPGFDPDGFTLLDDPGALPTEREAVRLTRAVLLRRVFNLMGACLSESGRPDDMAEIFVKEGLWGEGMHRLLVYSLMRPWAGGLLPRGSDGDEVEICE